MGKKSIQIIPLMGEKEKWCMCLGKFMTRAGIMGYNTLLIGDKKIPAYDAEKKKMKEFLN